MGTYYIPRNYKGETRFLYILTNKSLLHILHFLGKSIINLSQ